MSDEEKIKILNLLPITTSMLSFLVEVFQYDARAMDLGKFEYVRFYQAKPYFYSKNYIHSTDIDELLRAFSEVVL